MKAKDIKSGKKDDRTSLLPEERNLPEGLISRLAPGPGPSRLKVLVIEDDPADRTGTEVMLVSHGHEALVVDSRRAALAALDRERFDLVIMDLDMGDQDGYETAAAIREAGVSTGRRVPIVGMTARIEEFDRRSCLEAGLDGYLHKPFLAAALLDEIEHLIKSE